MNNNTKKKFLDEKGRVFGILSIIDVVAILGLIALCFGFYLKNNVIEVSSAGKDVDIEITLLMEIIQPYLADAIEVGDELYDHDHATGGPIGIITSKVVSEPYALQAVDGVYDYVSSEVGVNVLITVQGKGSYLNGRYSFNRVYELGVNASRYFESKYASFIGTVMDISTVE